MKHRISIDSIAHEYRLLRNRIAAEVQAPALVFVTSATSIDGASLTAYGLAESYSNTKQRTVLVTTSKLPGGGTPADIPRRRRESDRPETISQPVSDGRLSVVSISPERVATISRSGVASLVEELRSGHDYVIIDAGNLPENGFGLLLIASADATLVTFRGGRTQQPEDRLLLDMLERAGSKVLGVVLTEQASIDQFASSGSSVTVGEPAAGRRSPTGHADRFQILRNWLWKEI